jgi:hypothetical protein
MAGVIERLARDSVLRERLGAAARADVAARFEASRFGDALVHVYESMR